MSGFYGYDNVVYPADMDCFYNSVNKDRLETVVLSTKVYTFYLKNIKNEIA